MPEVSKTKNGAHPGPDPRPATIKLKDRRIRILLDECIQKSGLTLRQVSREVDMTPATISRIKTGKQLPTLETIQTLCNYLECSLSDMVRLE